MTKTKHELERINGLAPGLSARSKRFLQNTLAQATKRGYASDLKIFANWCIQNGVEAIPASPESIANFLADQAAGVLSLWNNEAQCLQDGPAISVATLTRRLSAIKYAHKLNKFEPSPTDTSAVRETLKGIRRTLGVRPKPKTALLSQDLQTLLSHIPDTLIGVRDRAILLLGFSAALRRSEITALTKQDLEFQTNGVMIYLRVSKTDQEGEGQKVGIANNDKIEHCAVQALKAWLEQSAIQSGPLFRRILKSDKLSPQQKALSDKSICNIVKHYCTLAGLDASSFGAHSLRRGFVTSAAKAQVDPFRIMTVTRHKKLETVKRYVDEANLIEDYAGADLLK